MERYQRILICIDQPERDYGMLTYAGAISRAAGARQVRILHVNSSEAPPADITPESLRALADKHFQGHGSEELVCDAVAGSPLVEILRCAMENDCDLIVIGRPAGGGRDTQHEATLARRVTRKATCSVLVLPQNAQMKADKILIPVRDSECSAGALEVACDVARIANGTVCCLNVFQITPGYERVGTTLEQHTALLEQGARRECERLLARVKTDGVNVVTRCVPDHNVGAAPLILDETEKESADLVVIGARGRTGTAGVLLGAVTEQLIRQSTVPVLAVKKKGECIGVLRALLSLT